MKRYWQLCSNTNITIMFRHKQYIRNISLCTHALKPVRPLRIVVSLSLFLSEYIHIYACLYTHIPPLAHANLLPAFSLPPPDQGGGWVWRANQTHIYIYIYESRCTHTSFLPASSLPPSDQGGGWVRRANHIILIYKYICIYIYIYMYICLFYLRIYILFF